MRQALEKNSRDKQTRLYGITRERAFADSLQASAELVLTHNDRDQYPSSF